MYYNNIYSHMILQKLIDLHFFSPFLFFYFLWRFLLYNLYKSIFLKNFFHSYVVYYPFINIKCTHLFLSILQLSLQNLDWFISGDCCKILLYTTEKRSDLICNRSVYCIAVFAILFKIIAYIRNYLF